MPTFKMPTFKMPTFKMPTFKMPTFKMPPKVFYIIIAILAICGFLLLTASVIGGIFFNYSIPYIHSIVMLLYAGPAGIGFVEATIKLNGMKNETPNS